MFQHELKYWLRQPSIYVYTIIFFLLGLTMMAEEAGVWTDEIGDIANTPQQIHGMITWFYKLILFLIPAIIGQSVYRDIKSNMYQVLYAYPFSKGKYLIAKFFSSFLVLNLVVMAIGLGLYFGTQLPSVNSEQLISFNLLPYFHTYFVFIIPTLFLLGTLVFAVVALSRNIYAGFVTIILLYILQGLIGSLTGNVDNAYTAALLDPLGDSALAYLTQYWTPIQQIQENLPIHGVVFFNRLLWVGVGILIFLGTFLKFEFSQQTIDLFNLQSFKNKLFGQKKRSIKPSNPFQFDHLFKINLTKVSYNFSFLQQLKTTWRLSNTEFRYIVTHRMFIIILVAGSIAIFAQLANFQSARGFELLPVTWKMLNLPIIMFSGIINVLTFLYAGMLVHRGRVSEMNHLIDITPIPNWSLMISKFLALVKMQLTLLTLILIGGISAQIYHGFYQFEIGHYLFELYILNFVNFLIWAFVAIFIQTVFTNAYLGLFLLIGGSMTMVVLPQFGIEPYIFRYNTGPSFDYSDLHGYGSSLIPYLIYKAYWFIFGLFLLLGTLLFWMRGISFSFLERFQLALSRFRGKTAMAMSLVLISFASLGFKIYYEEYSNGKVHFSVADEKKAFADFQKKYGHLAQTPIPKIVAVKTKMDIFPKEYRFEASGEYTIVNTTNTPIDTLIIRTGFDEITTYEIDQKVSSISSDTAMHLDVWQLEKSLQPNDSLTLSFIIKSPQNTIFETYHNVKTNGTFIASDAYPRLGYARMGYRKLPSDTTDLNISYMAADSDWIDFEAVVSTSSDQIALAPGYLQKEWTADNRHYFHYKMNSPIKFFFGFNSGQFEILRDSLDAVSLEVYYDKKHPYNIHRMMNGLKGALDFCNENYSKYQHQQARIIEYPISLGSHSTTFANSIPFAEYHFIGDIKDGKEDIDIPFYVAAHELAHQWWGNQIVPADVLGAKMITESLAEYTALKVLEKEYGKVPLRKFLKLNLDSYLKGRSQEYNTESSLQHVIGGQKYIAYRKGALIFYALSDYLGEDRLHGILKTFIQKNRYQTPYTTSLELIDLIQSKKSKNKLSKVT